MYWLPYLNDTDENVLYEVSWTGQPLYAWFHPQKKRTATTENVWAIKKYYYSGTTPIWREWAGSGKKDTSFAWDDRASYF